MRQDGSRARWMVRIGVSVCAVGVTIAASGCYTKITRAEGFGADRISTEEPDRRQGPVDKLIFGEDQPPRSNIR